jgi:NAD(P)-dependent dehydrogenase (short-subunit alcohol dehydrogenase family)
MKLVENPSARVALVTGAASGIGKAIAEAIADTGATTIFVDRNETGVVVAARASGARHQAFDVSDAQAWASAIDAVERQYGRLDILINCAGAYHIAPIAETDLQDWLRVSDSNLSSIFFSLKYGAPLLGRTGGALIVNIASTLGLRGREGMGAYAASKAGVISLTKSAAIEFARAGLNIRVNALCPGPTDTPIVQTLGEARLARLGGAEALKQRAVGSVPMGRLCEPSDIADAVLFLMSDKAAFITGACIAVDGGQSA